MINMSSFLDLFLPHTEQLWLLVSPTILALWAEQMTLAVSSALQKGISSLLLMMYFSAEVSSPAVLGSRVTRSRVWLRLLRSRRSMEQVLISSFLARTAAQHTVGSCSSSSLVTGVSAISMSSSSVFMFSDVMTRGFSATNSSSFATISSLASSMSGSDLITTSGSTLLMRISIGGGFGAIWKGLGGFCDGLVVGIGVRGRLRIGLPIGVTNIVVPLMFN